MRARLRRISLLSRFGVISLIPLALLGVILARNLTSQIRGDALADARATTQLTAQLALQPHITPANLRDGLDPAGVARLDRTLHDTLAPHGIVRVKVWSGAGRVVYSDDHGLLRRRFPLSDELETALDGGVASEVSDLSAAENARDRRFGSLLEVYAPLRFEGETKPAGAFEIYAPYKPVAARIAHRTHRVYVLLGAGLLLLWASLFRIIAGASRRLRRQAAENRHQALHDALTGLPNRTLFRDRVDRAIAAARRRGGEVAILLMDLDRFKEVNDTLGHGKGDHLLRELGPRLQSCLDSSETVARLGGDEFAVLLPEVEDPGAAGLVARQLLGALSEPIVLHGLAVHVEGSIGIALFPEHGDGADELLQRADVAMYAAKRSRGGYEVYAPDQDTYDPRRLALLGELRRAIDEDELVLHYQPKVALATGEVAGVEALVRWQHPLLGLLAPAEFIPLAEHTTLIRPLTVAVIGIALRDCRRWRDAGLDLEVSVNISVANLMDPLLADDVARLLGETRIAPRRLQLEITESVFMADPLRAAAVLRKLSSMGVGLSIDDYGTGHSSLAYLRRLPVGELKIDRSFVMGMTEDEGDAVIVRSTIDLARNLGLRVVAEGVETEDVRAALALLRCDIAQGFLFTRPMPAQELAAWVGGRSAVASQLHAVAG